VRSDAVKLKALVDQLSDGLALLRRGRLEGTATGFTKRDG